MAKILFLAQFAPENGVKVKTYSKEEEFYSKTYHEKIVDILKNNNYDFYSTSRVDYFLNNINQFDLVWSVYNRIGFRNSEIFIQSFCEYKNVKYIGASPNIRAMVEDKSMSKLLAEHLKIPTAEWVVASKEYPPSTTPPFNGPYFVKPRFGSASIGIDETCLCLDWNDVLSRAESYFDDNIDIIIERFIDGIYYGVPILNTVQNQPLIGKPHYQTSNKKGGVITNAQKRFTDTGMERFFINDKNLEKQLITYSNLYFNEMQCCDYARIDYIIDNKSGIPYFLEVNVLMNLGTHGGFVASFLEKDFKSYDDLIMHIIDLGLSKL